MLFFLCTQAVLRCFERALKLSMEAFSRDFCRANIGFSISSMCPGVLAVWIIRAANPLIEILGICDFHLFACRSRATESFCAILTAPNARSSIVLGGLLVWCGISKLSRIPLCISELSYPTVNTIHAFALLLFCLLLFHQWTIIV